MQSSKGWWDAPPQRSIARLKGRGILVAGKVQLKAGEYFRLTSSVCVIPSRFSMPFLRIPNSVVGSKLQFTWHFRFFSGKFRSCSICRVCGQLFDQQFGEQRLHNDISAYCERDVQCLGVLWHAGHKVCTFIICVFWWCGQQYEQQLV